MERKYYYPKIKKKLIWSVVLVLLLTSWMVGIYGSEIRQGILTGWITSVIIWSSLALLMINATYFVVEESSVKLVRMFIFRQEVKLENISQIRIGITGGIFRSPNVFLEYQGGMFGRASMGMDIEFYGKPMVIRFLRSIHSLDSSIPMDAASRKLMEEDPEQKEPPISVLFQDGKKSLFKSMFPKNEK